MNIKGTFLGFLFLILLISVVIPSVYLILFNSQMVSVDILVYEIDNIHLGTLLLITWLIASIVGFISGLGIPALFARYLETKKLEKNLNKARQELDILKSIQAQGNAK